MIYTWLACSLKTSQLERKELLPNNTCHVFWKDLARLTEFGFHYREPRLYWLPSYQSLAAYPGSASGMLNRGPGHARDLLKIHVLNYQEVITTITLFDI